VTGSIFDERQLRVRAAQERAIKSG